MNARNSEMRVIMLNNKNMQNQVMDFVEPRSREMFEKNTSSQKKKYIIS